MPYRDHDNALSARQDEIRRELEDVKARVGDFEYLKWRQKELENELVALGKSPAHLPDSRTRIEMWLMTALVVSVLGTAIFAVVAVRLRTASSAVAPIPSVRNDTTATPSSTMIFGGGLASPSTGNVPPTPHLTRTLPPPTQRSGCRSCTQDMVLGP